MTHRIVGYSTEPLHKDADTLPAPLLGNGSSLILTRYDGRSRAGAPAADRPALLDALFCLRVALADTLWVPDWRHLGTAATKAVVCAEVWAAGGHLAVGSAYVTPDDVADLVGPDLLDGARAAAAVRHQLSPRSEQQGTFDEPGDLGLWDSHFHLARLAHKLHYGFRLTQREVAEILSDAGYAAAARGDRLSERFVSRLLKDFDAELITQQPEEVRVDIPGLGRLLLALGDDIRATADAAARFNASRDVPLRAAPDAQPATEQTFAWLLDLVRTTVLVDTVFLGQNALLDDLVLEEVIVAWLYHCGVLVAGPGGLRDPGDRWGTERGRVAVEGTALFLRLREHDSRTLVETRRTREFAEALARREEGLGESRRAIARLFDAEAIPLLRPSKDAKWGSSAVHELLKDGDR